MGCQNVLRCSIPRRGRSRTDIVFTPAGLRLEGRCMKRRFFMEFWPVPSLGHSVCLRRSQEETSMVEVLHPGQGQTMTPRRSAIRDSLNKSDAQGDATIERVGCCYLERNAREDGAAPRRRRDAYSGVRRRRTWVTPSAASFARGQKHCTFIPHRS